jgi:hypothetical protein
MLEFILVLGGAVVTIAAVGCILAGMSRYSNMLNNNNREN